MNNAVFNDFKQCHPGLVSHLPTDLYIHPAILFASTAQDTSTIAMAAAAATTADGGVATITQRRHSQNAIAGIKDLQMKRQFSPSSRATPSCSRRGRRARRRSVTACDAWSLELLRKNQESKRGKWRDVILLFGCSTSPGEEAARNMCCRTRRRCGCGKATSAAR